MESLLFNAIVALAVLVLFYIVLTGAISAIAYLAFHAGYIGYNTFNYLIYAVSLLTLSATIFIYLKIYKKINDSKDSRKPGLWTTATSLLAILGLGVLYLA